MWLFSSLVFLANPLLGAVLLISAAVTTGLKVATVDRELAKQGKPPASYGLIDKWLDRRKAAGKAPSGEKPKPYGSWAYGKQRWLALWEDLGERHQQVRADYKMAVEKARRDGLPVPPKPTFKQTLTGWQWNLDQPTPAGNPDNEVMAGSIDDFAPNPGPGPAPRTATTAAEKVTGVGRPRPHPNRCPTCGNARPLTVFGSCEPCVQKAGHALCARCDQPMIRDGDVYRHHPKQGCDAVAPLPNQKPAPTPPRPTARRTQPAGSFPLEEGEDQPIPPGSLLVDEEVGEELYGANYEPPRQYATANEARNAALKYLRDQVDAASTAYRSGDYHTAEQHLANIERRYPHAYNHPEIGVGDNRTGRTVPLTEWHADIRRRITASQQQTEGDSMTAATQQAGEVTGIPSAVHFLNAMAGAHQDHADQEGILGSMANLTIGEGDINLVRAAMTASADAAEMYRTAATELDATNRGVREGFGSAPDAADKHAHLAE